MRKLIVDGQLFQTPAWHRGMGKYSLELLVGLAEFGTKNGWDSIDILLSGNISTEKRIETDIKKRLPEAKIVHLALLPNEIGNESIAPSNRKITDKYVNSQIAEGFEIDFIILSLMQGEIWPTFPTATNIRKLLLFYDLIPLMLHDIYLGNPITRMEYLSKIKELLLADKYFAISQTVANDLTNHLGISKSRVVSIDGGPVTHSDKLKKFDINEPFILMPTGNDLRKNNQRAIKGFNEFNKQRGNKYKLVVTSFFKKKEIAQLQTLSNDVILTGNISGQELNYLYENTVGLLFPPEYEGLGLPILEAVERNKRVACSDISVFREMSKTAFQYFNPYSSTDISEALKRLVDQKSIDEHEYKQILNKYTWKRTVNKLISALPKKGPENGALTKLSIFGPSPAGGTFGKMILASHAELSRSYNIEYYIERDLTQPERRIDYLPYIAQCRSIRPGMGYEPDDKRIPVYFLENSASCSNILLAALARPGIVVLQDASLKDLWKAAEEKGVLHTTRLALEREIDKSLLLGQHYLTSLVANSKACVALNPNTEKIVLEIAKKINKKIKVYRAPLPVNDLAYRSVLPQKTIALKKLETAHHTDKNFNACLTDFRFYEELSRAYTTVFDDPSSYFYVLEAMNLGVVPLVVNESIQNFLPNNTYRTAADSQSTEQSARQLIAAKSDIENLSKASIEYVEHKHTHEIFNSSLTQAVSYYDEEIK
jgi:glycosyltransferase involved in cell wall biosynthesis